MKTICYAVQYPYYIPEFDRQASAKSNSFLFDSTIFQISINNDELVLKVERTTDTNNAFYYYANKDIEFSNYIYENRKIEKVRSFYLVILL